MEIQGKTSTFREYGFVANPSFPLWYNVEQALGGMSVFRYFNRAKNMTYHNLCTEKNAPLGAGTLLGLGLKFCVQNLKPNLKHNDSFDRFRDDVRKRYHFAGAPDDFIPNRLYIKSTWDPPEADGDVETRMSEFFEKINFKCDFLKNVLKPSTNLKRSQQTHLFSLQKNRDFITLICDKNLGPAIMEREHYIRNMLSEHLLQADTYSLLSEDDARAILFSQTTCGHNIIFEKYKNDLDETDINYFIRSDLTTGRIPQLYGMPKVHKNKLPVPFRPVISAVGSISAKISTFIDVKLQPLTKYIPSYCRDSNSFLSDLRQLDALPPTARIFTSDATSMYTNIDPKEGISTLKKYFDEFDNECINENIQTDLLLELTALVMKTNVFQFGNTWWQQKIGTAMGTPCACIYATLFFAFFERTLLLVKYKHNLLFYKRQIDDIFAIWLPSNDPQAWSAFKQDLNLCSNLTWNTEPLSKSVNFLDLTLTIQDDGMIHSSTYQKPMNLFLYIPAHSAHPPGVFKSLIFGLIRKYHFQNTSPAFFQHHLSLLFRRLLHRGHKREDLLPLFHSAALRLPPRSRIFMPLSKGNSSAGGLDFDNENRQLFFHLPYHPKGISRAAIQDSYASTCNRPGIFKQDFRSMVTRSGAHLKIKKLTVCYSRAKNIRDFLVSSSLQETDTCNVSAFLPT